MWSSFSLGVGELFSFRSTVYQQDRQNRSTGERGGDCCGVENSSGSGVFPRWWKSIVVAEFTRYSWLNLKEILWNDQHVSPYFLPAGPSNPKNQPKNLPSSYKASPQTAFEQFFCTYATESFHSAPNLPPAACHDQQRGRPPRSKTRVISMGDKVKFSRLAPAAGVDFGKVNTFLFRRN